MSNLANNQLSFEHLQASILANANSKESQLLNALTDSNSEIYDVERQAFGSTTLGKVKSKKLAQHEVFNWHVAGDKDKEGVVDNMKILAVRGFILKAKDGYTFFAVPDGSSDGKKMPICQTTECTIGEYTYKTSEPSPYPLDRWINKGAEKDHRPSPHLKGLALKGSRGQSCHECVLNGNNIKFKKDADGNIITDFKTNKPIVEDRCGPSNTILFAVTHVAKKVKNGVEWLKVTEIKNEDVELYTTTPLILNIDSSGSAHGVSGNNSIAYKTSENSPTEFATIATASNKGFEFVPDDVKLFIPYWRDLVSQGLVSPAPKNTNFPEHPRLPFIVQAQTELYMASATGPVGYINSLPAYRTSGLLDDPQIFQEWLEVLNLYVTSYEAHLQTADRNDDTYKLAGSMPVITPNTETKAPVQQEFDATSDDSSVFVYSGVNNVA